MPAGPLAFAALWTRLGGPRLGDCCHLDAVLLADVRELIETLSVCPDGAGFQVRLDRPVLAEDAGEIAVIDGCDAVVVESLDQITKERVHGVTAPARPLPVTSSPS